MKWNELYIKRFGPQTVKANAFSSSLESLLWNATNKLQPQLSVDNTQCVLLIGSPGPEQMEFVSIPCYMRFPVSGIMCTHWRKVKAESHDQSLDWHKQGAIMPDLSASSRNAKMLHNQSQSSQHQSTAIIYSLIHWAWVNKKPYNLPQINNLINMERINWNSFNFSEQAGPWMRPETKFATPRENQHAGIAKKLLSHLYSPWGTVRHVYLCRLHFILDSDRTGKGQAKEGKIWPKVCRLMKNGSTDSPGKLFYRRTQVLIKQPEYSPIYSWSIHISNRSLVASFHCSPTWVLVNGTCLRLVKVVDGERLGHSISKWHELTCKSVDSSSKVSKLSSKLYKDNFVQKSVKLWDLQLTDIAFRSTDSCVQVNDRNLTFPCNEADYNATYVACERSPFPTQCPNGYILCDEECIPDIYICEDENRQICTTLFASDTGFCETHCHPDNCTCHSLYFQCASGGCLHSAQLCDGNRDCLYEEDETFCPEQYIKEFEEEMESVQSKTDDFFPDLANASDEKLYSQLLKTHSVPRNTYCSIGVVLPCMKGHSTCYPVDKQCVYDHDPDGSLRYCRNGAHLEDCTSLSAKECSGTFKCKLSYCIPIHKMCNGIIDCPYGDDETQCPPKKCHNMVHCGNICVHPNEICDGRVQCADIQDELICGAPICPEGCRCLGYSVSCNSVVMKSINPKELRKTKILIFRQNLDGIKLNAVHFPDYLLVLDVSNCSIRNIDAGMYKGLNYLITLNISHNLIKALSDGSLTRLANILHLDISWNPLVFVGKNTFSGLENLYSLSMHHCRLLHLSLEAFNRLESLSTIDVSYNKISVFDYTCLEGIRNLTVFMEKNVVKSVNIGQDICFNSTVSITSDQPGMCCLRGLNRHCNANSLYQTTPKCKLLLLPSFLPCIYFVECIVILFNTLSLVYNLRKTTLESMLISNLCLGNIFIIIPLHSVAEWHDRYRSEISFYEKFIADDVMCLMSGLSTVLSSEIPVMIMLLIAAVKVYGIKNNLLEVHSRMKNVVLICLLSIWITSCFITAMFATVNHDSQDQVFHCLLGDNMDRNVNITLWSLLMVGNVAACVFTVILYKIILQEVRRSHLMIIGQKHGKDITRRVMSRIVIIIMTCILSTICPVISILGALGQIFSSRILVTLFSLFFSLHAVSDPILYTFSTRTFLNDFQRWRQLSARKCV